MWQASSLMFITNVLESEILKILQAHTLNIIVWWFSFLQLLISLCLFQIWNVENPFDFMDNISLEGKTNFFEKRVGEYQKMGVAASGGSAMSREFSLDEDF